MKLVKFTSASMVLAASLTFPGWLVAADSLTPQAQQQGSASFISGGVGEEDRQRMQQLRSEYPVELLFVMRGNPNQFLSDVKVQITNRSGTVVDTVTTGPFLLAKMPPGQYTVTAESNGSVKRQTIQVGSGRAKRTMFVWPSEGNEAASSAGPPDTVNVRGSRQPR